SAKTLTHAGKIFGRQFSAIEELHEFLARFNDADDLSVSVCDPSRLIFDTEWTGSTSDKLLRAVDEFSHFLGDRPGDIVFNHSFGRMSQATDISWKSLSLGGVPLIDAETSWRYYNWSLEYDGQ